MGVKKKYVKHGKTMATCSDSSNNNNNNNNNKYNKYKYKYKYKSRPAPVGTKWGFSTWNNRQVTTTGQNPSMES